LSSLKKIIIVLREVMLLRGLHFLIKKGLCYLLVESICTVGVTKPILAEFSIVGDELAVIEADYFSSGLIWESKDSKSLVG
jgi:hypothetical protein